MPFNGSGSFAAPAADFPAVASTLIQSSKYNNVINDIATGLTTTITKDGQTVVTANIPLGGFKLTGVGAATARTDAATIATIQDGTGVYVSAVAGTADVITLTPSPAITAYAAGQAFRFIASGANTTAVTVNVSALGAKALTKNGTTALIANDIPSGAMVVATYDGTRFILGTMGAATYAAPFVDSTALVKGSADSTKLLRVEVDGLTTGTTRVLTPPDADLTLPAVTAAGDIPIASASGVLSKIAVGAAGAVPMSRAAAALKVAYVAPFPSHGYGSTWSHNAGNVTNDFDFAVGGCMDATGAYWMQTTTIIGKQANVAWAVGGTAGATLGMLDTGAVGNSDYYLWMIARSDTGVVDWLSSLSSTAPTMPANYDFKRLRGWFKRVAGANVVMDVYETEGGGVEIAWRIPTLDINLAATLTTTRRTDAVKVPLNFSTIANLAVYVTDAAAWNVNIVCPDTADGAVGATPDGENMTGDAGGRALTATMRVRTSATGTIAARATVATIDTYQVSTRGFTWARRQ